MFVNTVYRRSRRARRGQSLVEFALVLPILLFIMAGVLEVGNLLTIYNRVSLAAREGARFLASGGGTNDVVEVVEQNSAGSLYFDEDHTCIYVIHAQVASDGLGWVPDGPDADWIPDGWVEELVYPASGVCRANPEYQGSGVSWIDAWDQVVAAPHGNAPLADLQFVIVAMRYNADTLLSLPIYPQLQGKVPIQAFTVMRLEATVEAAAGKPTNGCDAYPIAINLDAESSPDDRKLSEAYEGDEFYLDRYTGTVDENLFTYLLWNDDHTTPDCGGDFDDILASSLQPPGNSLDGTCGFVDACEASDTSLHEGDCVFVNGSPGSDALTEMEGHVCPTGDWSPPSDCGQERALRVIVWDPVWSNLSGGFIVIKDFIIIRPIDIASDHSSMAFELVRWDHSCGQGGG